MSARIAVSTSQLVNTARDPAVPLREQHDAFTKLVEQSQHCVFGLTMASLRNVEEAKDAAQEAFTYAWMRLRQLRDPAAFGPWLKTIAATQCHRRLRCREESDLDESSESADTGTNRDEYEAMVAGALTELPESERHVTVLFYFLGHTQKEISALLRLKPGTVGKRLHSARLRMRRALPSSVRRRFVPLAPSRPFIEKVRAGLFDGYVGRYRFERRPELVVTISRQADRLISEAGGQRNVLVSLKDKSLLTSHYDGEGRFSRNRKGDITHFVYYEFGRRLGIARKEPASLRP